MKLLAALAVMVAAASASAAELIMVEEDYCHWCERWNKEIGVVYDKTDEGRRAPLRRIDASEPLPAELMLAGRANFTPTFILVEGGVEIGRIEGYPGDNFFWPMLNRLLDQLPEETRSGS